MKRCVIVAIVLIGRFAAGAEDDEKAWRKYTESGFSYLRAAEDATDVRDRRDNIQRAASDLQTAVRIGKDKSAWRPLTLAAEGFVRLVSLSSGGDKDRYTDLVISTADSAVKIAKSKGEREGMRDAIRTLRRLSRLHGGQKQKQIEANIQSIERDME